MKPEMDASQVAHYTQKFFDKMFGSSLDVSLGWIDGARLSDSEKLFVFELLMTNKAIEVTPYEKAHIAKYFQRYDFTKNLGGI